MATIKDVARKAGVSTATVSRVINGNHPVSDETQMKVKNAIESLNYRMNAIAKSLKTNKTNIIALVIPVIANDYLMDISVNIEKVISKHNNTLIVCLTDGDPEKEVKILKELNEMRVDGVILFSTFTNDIYLKDIIEQGLKVVFIDAKIDDLNSNFVVEDNATATYQLVDMALKYGHKKVGVIKGGDDNYYTTKERMKGYLSALDDNNIVFDERYNVEGYYSIKVGCEGVKKMIMTNKDDLPTLLFATNNYLVEGALLALKELGLNVPRDISLISYGNVSNSSLVEPKITCVEHNSREIGERAGELILDVIECSKSQLKRELHIVKTEINEGNSIAYV